MKLNLSLLFGIFINSLQIFLDPYKWLIFKSKLRPLDQAVSLDLDIKSGLYVFNIDLLNYGFRLCCFNSWSHVCCTLRDSIFSD